MNQPARKRWPQESRKKKKKTHTHTVLDTEVIIITHQKGIQPVLQGACSNSTKLPLTIGHCLT